jgi:hypothetical protein
MEGIPVDGMGFGYLSEVWFLESARAASILASLLITGMLELYVMYNKSSKSGGIIS